MLLAGALAVAAFCALLIAQIGYDLGTDRATRRKAAIQRTGREVLAGAREVDQRLQDLKNVADSIAELLESDGAPETSLRAAIERALAFHADIDEIGVAYRPFVYRPSEGAEPVRLHGVAASTEGRHVRWAELDALEDYTREDVAWYHRPMADGEPSWVGPAYDERSDSIRVAIARPFRLAATAGTSERVEPDGVVYVAFGVDRMKRLVNALDLGEKGYCHIVSRDGRFVVHPDDDRITKLSSDEERERREDGLEEVRRLRDVERRASRPPAPTPPATTARDDLTGHESWLFYEPLDAAGWTLGAVTIQDDALIERSEDVRTTTEDERRKLMLIALMAGMIVVCLLMFARRLCADEEGGFWLLSIGVALVCLGIAASAAIVVRSLPVDRKQSRIAHQAALGDFQNRQNGRILRQCGELPLFVPTGIYVQSASFLAANEVQLTGFVWQSYTNGVHDGISRGFAMPESGSMDKELISSENDGSVERMVWRFNVTLNQEFDYSHYPLGNDDLWVQLWHEDFARNVILVPDLDSYKLISPRALPGLKDGLELPGWDVMGTYFSYREHTYQTDFGSGDYSGLTDFPELYFNILIKKQLTGPMISDFLPLFVVAILMFTILMLSTRRDQEMTVTGFSGMNVIAACGGFFLVVVFSHIGLRRNLAVKDFVYIEYFYFLSYVLILLVSVNSLMYSRLQHPWALYRENLIARLAFWPLSSLAILGFTWWTLF